MTCLDLVISQRACYHVDPRQNYYERAPRLVQMLTELDNHSLCISHVYVFGPNRFARRHLLGAPQAHGFFLVQRHKTSQYILLV